MNSNVRKFRGDSQGFTLVELAVVMIIIGILIGGILKGQELITNARVTTTAAQLNSLSAAKNDFQNQYNALPGDMLQASTRLANCTNCAADDGNNGDGILDVPLGTVPAAGDEAINFYLHLLAAGYITGMNGENVAAFGLGLPTAPVGGGFGVGQHAGTGATGFPDGRAGVYITLMGQVANVANGNGILTTVQAQRMDTRIDDGAPHTGSLIADTVNTAGGKSCALAGPPPTYDGTALAVACSMAFRI